MTTPDSGAVHVLVDAVALATAIHHGQVEKSSGGPYIAHPVRVALAVLEAGGTVEQGAAALLHDTIEDGGARWWPAVEAFGPTVTAIVRACSDAEPADGHKAPWLDRKLEHVATLRAGVDPATYLVVAADKRDAVERTLAELAAHGDAFWGRGVFKGGRLGTVWYYRSMAGIVADRLPGNPLADDLAGRTAALVDRAGLAGSDPDEVLERARSTPWPDGIRAGEGGPA